jgi:8-oxo-dGTP pyrophosphatase MutT (NUDIX family)
VELLPYAEYARSLNRKRTAAGVLIRDEDGRVLLLETSYKPEWEIPGGAAEVDEAPWTTAVREVREELGLDLALGRLLIIDHVPADDVMPEGLAFIWDGGTWSEAAINGAARSDPEIISARFCAADEVSTHVKPILAGRIAAAISAAERGVTALCTNGALTD